MLNIRKRFFLLLTIVGLIFSLASCTKKNNYIEVEFDVEEKVIVVGETIDLKPTVNKGDSAGDVTLVYVSRDEKVATYSNAKVTGVAVGQTVVKAYCKEKEIAYDTVIITVIQDRLPIMDFGAVPTRMDKKSTYQLECIFTPEDAGKNVAFDFTSSNPDVISVDHLGFMSAKALGNATITVVATNLLYENETRIMKFEIEVTESEFVINYELNGGTNAPSNPAGYDIFHLPIALEAATKVGYKFAGWYDNAEFSGNPLTEIPANSKQDYTLYAKWDLITYNVSYDLANGTGATSNPTTYTVEDTLPIVLEAPTRGGAEFLGWYQGETKVESLTLENLQDFELVAKWKVFDYEIKYNLNGGQWSYKYNKNRADLVADLVADYNKVNGTSHTVEAFANLGSWGEAANGAKFLFNADVKAKWGWLVEYIASVAGSANKPAYENIYKYETYDDFTKVSGDYIYEINYELRGFVGGIKYDKNNKFISADYSVEEIGNGFWDKLAENVISKYNANTPTFNLSLPAYYGYTFLGWFDQDNNQIKEVEFNSFGDIEVTAKWEITNFSITYQYNGGLLDIYTYESRQALVEDLVADYNKVNGTSHTVEAFANLGSWSEAANGPKFLFNAEVKAKWGWLVEYIAGVAGSANKAAYQNVSKYDSEDKFNAANSNWKYAIGYELRGFVGGIKYSKNANYVTADYSKEEIGNGFWDKYLLEEGKTAPVKSFVYTDEVITLATPVKAGNDFLGWYLNGTKVETIDPADAKDVVLVARWSYDPLNIEYVLSDGKLPENAPTTFTYAEGLETLPVPTKLGYTFKGWYSDAACTTKVEKIAKELMDGVKLYASWELTVFDITYELNGGQFIRDEIVDEYDSFDDFAKEFVADYAKVTGVTDVTVNNFYGKTAKIGLYSFFKNEEMAEKWNWLLEFVQEYAKENNYSGATYLYLTAGAANFNKYARSNFAALLQETMLNNVAPISMNFENVDSEAFWEACPDKTIQVGTESVNEFTMNDLPIVLTAPNKKDATFVGWYLNEDLKNGKVTELTVELLKDVKLYARWSDSKIEFDTFNIEYQLFGGTLPESAPKTYLEEKGTQLVEPTREGYTFAGWYLDAEYTKAIEKITELDKGDKVLYAKYDAIDYDITYVVGEGTLPTIKVPVGDYADYAAFVADFVKDFNAFSGRTVAADGSDFFGRSWMADGSSAGYSFLTSTEYGAKYQGILTIINETRVARGATALTSTDGQAEARGELHNLLNKTAPSSTTASYGSDYSSEEVYGKVWKYFELIHQEDQLPPTTYNVTELPYKLAIPTAPEKLQFAGWYKDAELTGEAMFSLPIGTLGDITLYAKYEPKDYKITYELNGGTLAKDAPVKWNGTEDVLLLPAEKEMFEFAGWTLNGNKVEKLVAGDAYDVTLVASWEATPVYEITYNLDGGKVDKLYGGYDDFAAQFLADYNKYGNCNVAAASFHTSTSANIKVAFANSEMLAKYKWLFEFIKAEMSANIEASNNQDTDIAKEGLELLTKLISGDTAAINGEYANGRSVIRHFIHNLLNKDHESAGNTGGTYLAYTTDFAAKANRDKLVEALPDAQLTEEYTRFDSVTLYKPVKEGYVFVGWFIGDKEVTEVAKGTKGDLEINAKFVKIYSITFEVNEGTVKTDLKDYIEINEVELPVPTKTGFVFRGWFDNAELTGEALTKLVKGTTGDKTLYAKWEAEVDYTISYDVNGGKFTLGFTSIDDFANEFVADFNKYGNCNVAAESFHTSTSANIKVAFANSEMLAKYKWLFEFIKAEMSANIEASNNQDTDIAKEGLELLTKLISGDTAAINGDYANGRSVIRHFIHNLLNKDHESAGNTNGAYLDYTNDFSTEANQAKFLEAAKVDPVSTFTENSAFALPTAKKEGFDFVGWKDGDKVITEIVKGSTGNKTLVAEWKYTTYTITYDTKGGELGYTDIADFATLFLADYNKYGNCNVAAESFHTSTSANVKVAFANSQMLAKYKWLFEFIKAEMSANIEASNNQDTDIAKEGLELLTKLISGDTAAINGSYPNGRSVIRHFIHNLLNKDHESAGNTNGAYLDYTNDFSTETNQAKFLEKLNELNEIKYSFTEVDTVTLPTFAKKEGFKFAGWYQGENKVEQIAAGTRGNVTLVAKWEGNVYNIKYDLAFGSFGDDVEVINEYKAGVGLDKLPEPTKSGVNFLGWYDEDDNLVTSISDTTIGDITLYAKYSEGNYDPSYNITYVLDGGNFTGGYTSVTAIGADFLADFNKYAGTSIQAANFVSETVQPVKTALGNAEMLAEWNWLFALMYNHLVKLGSTSDYVTTSLPLIKKISEGDTNAIVDKDNGANVRTIVRHYLHGMMNESQGDSITNATFAVLTPDFSKDAEQEYVLANQYKLTLDVAGGSTLPVPEKLGFTFKGWKNAEGKITDVANLNGIYTAQWEENTPVTSVSITNKVEKIAVLSTYQLTWSLAPAEALVKDVKFTSDNEEVATVDKNGQITTLKNGTVTITIKSLSKDGHTDTMTFKVYTPGHFDISYETTSYVEIDNNITLNAQFVNDDATITKVLWESLDTSIATVDENGVVKGLVEGVVTIRAKHPTISEEYVDFVVTVITDTVSEQLELILKAHESNIFTRLNLEIGNIDQENGTGYHSDIIGSVSKLLFNDPLNINRQYEKDMLNKYKKDDGDNDSSNDVYDPDRKMESIEFITFHYTAGFSSTSDAKANMSYFSGKTTDTSIHYTVGNDGIYSGVDEHYRAAHAGDSSYPDHANFTGNFKWYPTGVKYDDVNLLEVKFSASEDFYFEINGKKTSIALPKPYNYNDRNLDHTYNADGTITAQEDIAQKWAYFENRTPESFFDSQGFPITVIDGEYYMGPTWWCYTQVYEGRICGTGGNSNSIGIESCVNRGSDLWWTWQRGAKLVADIMKRNSLDISRVKGHHFFSAKECPQPMLENDLEIWWEFIDLVQVEREAIDTLDGYTVEFESTSDYVNDYGRIVKHDNYSQVISYTVKITKDGKTESVTLSSVLNGLYTL